MISCRFGSNSSIIANGLPSIQERIDLCGTEVIVLCLYSNSFPRPPGAPTPRYIKNFLTYKIDAPKSMMNGYEFNVPIVVEVAKEDLLPG